MPDVVVLTFLAYVTFAPGLPDQGYDDSDDSSVFSTPSPKTKQRGVTPPMLLPLSETQHASLKRKKVPEKPEPMIHRTPMLEKSQSLQAEIASQRPLSMVIASQSEANVIVNPATGSLQRQVGQQVCNKIINFNVPGHRKLLRSP